MTEPSVGRTVHYVSHGSPVRADGTQAYTAECRAAIVTQVNSPTDVGLCVLNPSGLFFHEGCPYDEWDGAAALPGATPQGGSWHWPERV